MTQILVPTGSAEDWKRLLAQPERHWKAGFSAMTLARAWEAAKPGFPPEVMRILGTADRNDWRELRPLLAIPEFHVDLPGGERASQTDVVALARGAEGLVALAVEGKVDETLGPTVGEKRSDPSPGITERLAYLTEKLELSSCPDGIRYQLLHRTVSALRIADDFAADTAIMLVHSFSPTSKWLGDFQAFAVLLGGVAEPGSLVAVGKRFGVCLYLGWCVGDQRFRSGVVSPEA